MKKNKQFGEPVGLDKKGRQIVTGHTVQFGTQIFYVNSRKALSSRNGGTRRIAHFREGEWDPKDCTLVTNKDLRLYYDDGWKIPNDRLYAEYDKTAAPLPVLEFGEELSRKMDEVEPDDAYPETIELTAKVIRVAMDLYETILELRATIEKQLNALKALQDAL